MMYEVAPAGELGIRLMINHAPEPALTRQLLFVKQAAQQHFGNSLTDSVIGYNTLTLFFRSLQIEREPAIKWLEERVLESFEKDNTSLTKPKSAIVLPVYYHPSVAPDLERVAEQKDLTIDAVIALHSETNYFAFATGFAPGFCYLGNVHSGLETPRLKTPRQSVPAGAVAIADRQTAVYPCKSPGGWHLIGACPIVLFNISSNPANLIAIGDTVKFEPIDRGSYIKLGGKL